MKGKRYEMDGKKEIRSKERSKDEQVVGIWGKVRKIGERD